MTRAPWELRKADQRTACNADQTELLALRMGTAPIDEGIRDDRMADAMDDYGAGGDGIAGWAADDGRQDDAVGDVGTELERRAALMGPSYPFAKEGNRLKYSKSHTLAYELCLAISVAPTLNAGRYVALPPSFERLCRDVLKCFLGPGAEAVRTGWPVDGERWRTSKFRSVADHLNRETSEWVWSPSRDMPEDPSHKDIKDLGIDIAAWKRVADGRKGMVFLLGQCACGDDWTNKFKDLDIQEVESWFRYLSVATPVRLFCIPRHIVNASYFEEVNRRAGLTMDRARLVMLAEDAANRAAILAGYQRPATELIGLVVDGARVGGGGRPRGSVRRPRRRNKA